MPFFLDGNPTQSELSEAVNYLLSNFIQNTSADPATGQVITPTGRVQGYLYRYLAVKYADNFDGTVNFSNTPTNRYYYGLRNTDTATPESSNPADYIWYQVTGGFSTTKLVYYTVTGGRQINLIAALAAPSTLYQSDTGTAIDLDIISGSDGASSRICYAKSTSFALASTPSTYQTTGNASFPPANTWGGAETWQATPPTLLTNEALFQSNGVYNPTTNLTTWNVPYLSNLKVGALSAITADLGTITAGDLSIGSSPAISGTTMTGTGAHIYSNGRFVYGNSTTNLTFNGSALYANGFLDASSNAASDATFIFGSGSSALSLQDFNVPLTNSTIMWGANTTLTIDNLSATAVRVNGSIFLSIMPIVEATSIVAGSIYVIRTVGSTNFTAIGAASNSVGTYFTSTGTASGSGTAYKYTYFSGSPQFISVEISYPVVGNSRRQFPWNPTSIATLSPTTLGYGMVVFGQMREFDASGNPISAYIQLTGLWNNNSFIFVPKI